MPKEKAQCEDDMSKENSLEPLASNSEGNNEPFPTSSSNWRKCQSDRCTNDNSSRKILPKKIVRPVWISNPNSNNINDGSRSKKHDKSGDVPNSDIAITDPIDVSRLTERLTRMIFQNDNTHSSKPKRMHEIKKAENPTDLDNSMTKEKKICNLLDENQTLQIKKVLVDCLQNIDRNLDDGSLNEKHEPKFFCHKSFGKIDNVSNNVTASNNISSLDYKSCSQDSTKASLLRSYLSGSNPAREEYVSKKGNVSNSFISSDSIHHSILLESGRERRQCLLQYLSNVVGDGQVVIYVNSIPSAEALMSFLKKHGFQVNAVHPRLLLAESNWILSEYSLKKFSILLCAEDHYHSCPAHFRWVKSIINYEMPISNPTENWSIRNGIVEFSDNLPVHIYTFIKKSCPLEHELMKFLRLDSQENQEILPVP